MSARQRERVQKTVEERHGWALNQSHAKVRDLQQDLEEEQYEHLLSQEALSLRLKKQKEKEKDSLMQAEGKQNQLQELVTAAERRTKELERRLRIEATALEKGMQRSKKADGMVASMRTQLEAKCDEETRIAVEVEFVRKKEKDLQTRLTNMGSDYKRTCDELMHAQGQVDKWKAYDKKQRVTKKKTADVSCCPDANILMLPGFYVICLYMFCFLRQELTAVISAHIKTKKQWTTNFRQRTKSMRSLGPIWQRRCETALN
jgi:chromosome segregation ATPase